MINTKEYNKTIVYSIMYIALAISTLYYSSMYKIFDLPVLIVAGIPQAIFYILGCYKIFILDKHSKTEIITIILFAIINIISLLLTNFETNFLFLFFAVFAAKDVDYETFLKHFFFILFSLFVFIFLSSLIGIIPNIHFGNRLCFGIISPTDFGAYVFYFFLLYSYLTNKHKYLYALLGIIASTFVLLFSRARLDYGMLLITMVSFVIYDYKKEFYKVKIIKDILILSPAILIILTATITILFDTQSDLILKIDSLLSTRVSLMNKAFHNYPITLLGQQIVTNGWGWTANGFEGDFFFLDNYYCLSLYRYGLINFITLWSLMVLSIWYSYKIDNIKMALVLLMISGTSFVDHHILELSYNPFLVFIGVALYYNFSFIEKKRI